eukprot:6641904-Ditylum_brightwellii.AAC.1
MGIGMRCMAKTFPQKKTETNSAYPVWIGQIIRETWMFQKRRWSAQNEALHKTAQKNNITKKTHLAQMTGLYAKQECLRVQDQFPFITTIAEWQGKSTTQMRL